MASHFSKPPPPQRANFASLRRYAAVSHADAYAKDPNLTDHASLIKEHADYDKQLTTAITEIRRKIMDQEMGLSQLKSQRKPPQTTRLRSIQAQKSAHNQGFKTIDYLPPPESPLNALVAYKYITHTISQTTQSLSLIESQYKSACDQLAAERSRMQEQESLTTALRKRLAGLEEAELQISAAGGGGGGKRGGGGKELILEMEKRRNNLQRKTGRLLKELTRFVDARLSKLLAAETLGGPVVGEEFDVDEMLLEGGLNKRGRPTRSSKNKNKDKDNNSRRIDEMWNQGEEGPGDLAKIAGKEMKMLLEELMNQSLEMDPYVRLQKDSAAARFLVRSRVAAFHEKDAERLRLIDFGRDVEDG